MTQIRRKKSAGSRFAGDFPRHRTARRPMGRGMASLASHPYRGKAAVLYIEIIERHLRHTIMATGQPVAI